MCIRDRCWVCLEGWGVGGWTSTFSICCGLSGVVEGCRGKREILFNGRTELRKRILTMSNSVTGLTCQSGFCRYKAPSNSRRRIWSPIEMRRAFGMFLLRRTFIFDVLPVSTMRSGVARKSTVVKTIIALRILLFQGKKNFRDLLAVWFVLFVATRSVFL